MHKGIYWTSGKGRFGHCAGKQLLTRAPHCSAPQRTISTEAFTLFYIKMDCMTQIPEPEKLTQHLIQSTLSNKPIPIFTYGSKWQEQLYTEQVWSKNCQFLGAKMGLKVNIHSTLFPEGEHVCVCKTLGTSVLINFKCPSLFFVKGRDQPHSKELLGSQ